MHLISSAIQSKSFEPEFMDKYSRFKHGSKTIAREFGRLMADNVAFPQDSSLIIYSAPHNNIPTASNVFKDYFLADMSYHFYASNIQVKQGKISRAYSYDDDYSSMSRADREKAISSDLFHIDTSFIAPDDILVFVDDIKITGSHERRILEMVEREGITNDLHFVYIADYTGDDPTIENRLNHYSIKNLKHINSIVRNEEFIFNTRVVKFILKADIEEFVSFITYQDLQFRKTLYSYSVLNNYADNEKYKVNFNILTNQLTWCQIF